MCEEGDISRANKFCEFESQSVFAGSLDIWILKRIKKSKVVIVYFQ